MGLDRNYDYLLRGIGLFSRCSAEGLGCIYLKGAVINGVLYGDTTKIIVGINGQDQQIQTSDFELFQNYPNPFNPTTNIRYLIKTRQLITLKVYDTLGKQITTLVNEEKPAGNYSVKFDGSILPTGTYFYRFYSPNYTKTKKMLLLK